MKLIIAEKPSLARNIVTGIGSMQRKNGYFENDEYLVTWAFGHLFSLYDIEEYQDSCTDFKWKMEGLPCFPTEFKFHLKKENNKVDSGVLKQFNIIKELINRDDVDLVINAGSSDREGEIIVRLIVDHA